MPKIRAYPNPELNARMPPGLLRSSCKLLWIMSSRFLCRWVLLLLLVGFCLGFFFLLYLVTCTVQSPCMPCKCHVTFPMRTRQLEEPWGAVWVSAEQCLSPTWAAAPICQPPFAPFLPRGGAWLSYQQIKWRFWRWFQRMLNWAPWKGSARMQRSFSFLLINATN